jgi:endogenous inhibitor of DNA gyrase (YacG/DUF329 family)
MIDLGLWGSERYRVAGDEAKPDGEPPDKD